MPGKRSPVSLVVSGTWRLLARTMFASRSRRVFLINSIQRRKTRTEYICASATLYPTFGRYAISCPEVPRSLQNVGTEPPNTHGRSLSIPYLRLFTIHDHLLQDIRKYSLRTWNSVVKQIWHRIIIKKLRGRSPQANYTDRATAACRRS
jgi:hypothetical protein